MIDYVTIINMGTNKCFIHDQGSSGVKRSRGI